MLNVTMRTIAAGVLLAINIFAARAELTIDITEGVEGAIPIAIVPFAWRAAGATAPVDLAAVVSADLEGSGLFRSLPARDMLAQPSEASQVSFIDWQALGQENLVIGSVTENGANRYSVRFELFDVFKGAQMAGYRVEATSRNLRQTAHRISDIIYEKLTGRRGAFSTQVAYVSVSGTAANQREYQLRIADADGYGPQTVTTSPEPLMSPAWSPDGKRIAYVSFEAKAPAIYVQTLATGQRIKVSGAPGINGAPAWSPDGSQLAITLSKDGNPDIFILSLNSGSLRRLTESYAIDTEPTWSSDGRSIVFTSDRGGRPQLYAVSVNGGNPRRITFEGSYNAGGVFAPDGKSLALVHGSGADYRIGLLDIATGSLRTLTSGPLDESPSFAPNGSMILYASGRGGRGELSVVSADGRVSRNVVMESGEVRQPARSPFL